jgi:DnaJ-class molecular chaperone
MPYEVCSRCRGNGTVVRAIMSVWTEADRDEDPEGFDQMRRGQHDVPCPMCGGKRVVEAGGEAEASYADRMEDAKTRAMENGDYEVVSQGAYEEYL